MISDARGRYSFANVWPGEYKLYAWESMEFRAWRDPELLKKFERQAKLVRVEEASSVIVDSAVIPAEGL
jgi:hypothetical protein